MEGAQENDGRNDDRDKTHQGLTAAPQLRTPFLQTVFSEKLGREQIEQ